MITLVSYASPWDMHEGVVSVCDLPEDQQSELIRLTLSTEGDPRQYSMDRDLIKTQVDGLWSLIVWIGLELERNGVISNFDARESHGINAVVQFFEGTKLGNRLRDALDLEETPQNYDWTELTPSKVEALTDFIGHSLAKTKAHLLSHLSTITEELSQPPPAMDLSPIQPSLLEKIEDIFFRIFDRKKYDFRIINRKVMPYKIRYFEDVEQEFKATVGEKVWLLFLDTQASDVNFLKATHLLYETGFMNQTPAQHIVPHIVTGLRVYLTESKSIGIFSILAAGDTIKSARRK